MQYQSMHKLTCTLAVLALVLTGAVAHAQDAVRVDPKHYTVEFENDAIRVLRIHYGPGEKSVMHGHPDAYAIFLTDGHVKFALPDGKTEMSEVKAGQTRFTPAGKHLPENVGNKAFDLVLVELKGKAAAK